MEHTLAQGGFGTVVVARRQHDGQRVAIKVAHRAEPSARDGLRQEAEALRTIGPPLVPEVYALEQLAEGRPFLVMGLVAQPVLAEVLARQGGPLPEAGRYALALAEALEAFHRRGFLHGDLKPENVFLVEEAPAVGFFDLGLARRLRRQGDREERPGGGLRGAGTPEYMAPEQCRGEEDLDERTDVYAAGVLLFEMLTGRPPFFGPEADVLQAHLSHRPPRPSELAAVPVALEEVVLRCLAKERSHRHDSAQALRLALRQVLEGATPAAPPPSSKPAPRAGLPQRSVALLCLRSGAGSSAVKKALARGGGQLAFHEGSCFAAVFDPEATANPLLRAHQCAVSLLAEGVAGSVLVDVATVRVQRRASGPPHYLSALFARAECYPTGPVPPALLLTEAVVAELPGLECVPVPGREGLFRQLQPLSFKEDTPLPRMGPEVLVGRRAERDELVRTAQAAIQARATTLATVLGEVGTGKSHLASVLAQHLRERFPAARVVCLRAREQVLGAREGTLYALLRAGLGLSTEEPTWSEATCREQCEAMLGPALTRELWPALASCLGWPSSPEALRGLAAAPGALHALAVRATGELLSARARLAPLLLLVDDAHFAEDAALDALEYATRAGRPQPLWVCVLARASFERSRRRWGTRAAHRLTLRLGPLSPNEAVELCHLALHPVSSVPTEALERLAERAQRVPLFLVELVRGLKRQGLVRQRPGGSWYLATDEVERVPELRLVEWLAHHELAALPPGLAAHARLCALLGNDFSFATVEGVMRELERQHAAADFPLDARQATRRLVEQGLLVDHGRQGLRFRHGLVREVVTRSLSEAQRESIHRAAHAYYLSGASAWEPQRLPHVALHAAAAGLREEAAALYIDLAELARGRHSYLEAETTYSQALELLPESDGLRRMTVLRGRGLMRYRVGRYEDSREDLSRACALARQLGDTRGTVDLLLDEAMALDWTHDYEGSAARVDEALALALSTRLDTPLLQVGFLLGMGRTYWRRGQWEDARVLLEGTVVRARRLGNAGHEPRVIALVLLGFILPNLGCIDEAEQALEECIAACIATGDRLHLGSAIANRRNLWIARGDLRRALEDQEQLVSLGRELGMVGWEYIAEYNLGELHYQAGDPAAAGPHIARVVELERSHPEVAPRPLGLLLRARVLAYEGREEEARQVLRSIHQALAERTEAQLVASESVLLALVELASREATAEEWEALRRRSEADSVEQEPLEVLELQALAHLRRGERQRAVQLLEEALRRGERLPNIMRPRLERSLERALGA